jgi:cytochrome c biogenesis factor
LAETSLRSTPVDDVQVALRRADDEGRALYEVWVRPLAVWVWWGGLLAACGGAFAMRGTRGRAREPEPALAQP